jgi:hypothetical protein
MNDCCRRAVNVERQRCAELVRKRGMLRVKQKPPKADVLVYRAIDPTITADAILLEPEDDQWIMKNTGAMIQLEYRPPTEGLEK